ncbi:hypothetical protein J6590_108496 [Homalodisca vitripennis]|nr:hypothetical protein J6590_108496 [Homalodisca vitripennis]
MAVLITDTRRSVKFDMMLSIAVAEVPVILVGVSIEQTRPKDPNKSAKCFVKGLSISRTSMLKSPMTINFRSLLVMSVRSFSNLEKNCFSSPFGDLYTPITWIVLLFL